MPKPPAHPRPAMRWGVYNKRGILIGTEPKKRMGEEWGTVLFDDGYVRRVMVTPIASKGEQ